MKIKFLGAAREVTGSKHLIITKSGKRFLLDCGMYQGKGLETDALNKELGFNAEHIDFMLLSHAHIDHSGLIPYLYNEGFRGKVYCTDATRDLCSIMLPDSGGIQEQDTKTFNDKRALKGLAPVEPIYTKEDAVAAMDLFHPVPYNKEISVDGGIYFTFTNVGHILGAAAINIKVHEEHKTHTICYTGDLGRKGSQILQDPQRPLPAEIIITESTYGDRLHETLTDSEKKLLEIVKHTCVEKKGKLIIPSFSVGRTQEIIYALDKLSTNKLLPLIDVYVDSPLSTNATNIMRNHPDCFNEKIRKYMVKDPDPFGFNKLKYIQSKEESKKLNDIKQPCIIISASGMAEAGRVKHHITNSVSHEENTILFVGYCAPSTLGARLLRGDTKISIFGIERIVRAEILRLESYSAHGDYKEMADYLNYFDKSKIVKLFLVHGEYDVQQHYAEYLHKTGFKTITIPEKGEEFGF